MSAAHPTESDQHQSTDHDHHDQSVPHRHHDHLGHDHHHAPADFGPAFLLALLLNTAFIATEVTFGIVGHSLALIADAGHNLGDLFGLVLAWVATVLSKRRASRLHTYGFKRSSVLAAFLNAVLLLVSVGIIVGEAIQRFGHLEPIDAGTVGWVAGAGVAVNLVTAFLFMTGRKSDLNLKATFYHFIADAAVSLSVILAAIGISLTNWLWLDPVLSLAIALVIVWGTWGLLRDTARLGFDGVPPNVDIDAVRAYLHDQPAITNVHHLHIWGLSTTEAALTVHVVAAEPLPKGFIETINHDLAHRFGIGHATIQIENQGDPPCPDEDCTGHSH